MVTKKKAENNHNLAIEKAPYGFKYSVKTIAISIRLVDVSKTTGVPVQILADNGSNIKKGVEDFIAENSEVKTRQTYDVTHKAAIILKNHMINDEQWKLFVEFTSNSKRDLLHTVLGYISPPKAKTKSRWLNLDVYLKWAERISCLKKVNFNKDEYKKFQEKLKWLKDFKGELKEWRSILDLLQIMKDEAKTNGFNCHIVKRFEAETSKMKLNTSRLKQVKTDILNYITAECKGFSDDAWPSSSDIIESVFGKYKKFSGKIPMKEVGKAVLTMPVLTSTIDYQRVKDAMETISAKDVNEWINDNLGKSLFAKRKTAYKLFETKKSVKQNNANLKKAGGF